MLLLATCASGSHASPRIATTPVWVTALDLPSPKDIAAIQPADGMRYVLLDDQVALLDAEPVHYRRFVYAVTGEQGLAEAGRLDMRFQPDYEEVLLHSVSILREGKQHSRTAGLRFERLRRETGLDSGIVDGEETWHVTIPDVRVGDSVEIAYSVTGQNPVFGGQYYSAFSTSYDDALGVRRVRLLHPDGRPIRHRVTHPMYRASRHVDAGLVDSAWVARALPGVRVEADVPPWFDAFGSIELSEAAGWAQVAAWARPLFAQPLSDRSLAKQWVETLELSAGDRAGSVARALAFAQGEIRYTGIEIGVNSHAPKAPELTLEQRYGDCKDKATLLIALLAEIGVEAEPILVNTDVHRGVRDFLPRATAFDHVIVRILDVPGWTFVDPTREREVGPAHARATFPYEFGLRVAHDVSNLIAIPRPVPTQPEVAVEQVAAMSLDAAKQGDAGLGVVTTYRRGHASGVRAEFADGDAASVGETYLEYMRDIYTDIEQVAAPSFLDRPAIGFARVDEQYRVRWDESDLDASLSLFLFQISDWTKVPKGSRRTQPMQLSGPRWGRQTIRARSPGGWGIDAEEGQVENDHFRFERKVSVMGDTLVVAADWRRKRDFVAPADFAAVRKDLLAVRELLDYPVRVGGTDPLPQEMRARDVLWPLSAMVLVAGFFTWSWRFRARSAVAGIVFQPRRTAVALVNSDAGMRIAIVCIVIASVLGVWLNWDADAASLTGRLATQQFFGLTFKSVLTALIGAALVRMGFRWLKKSVAFEDLVRVMGWALVPFIVCVGGAILAIGGRVALIGSDVVAAPHEILAVVTMLSLLFLGIGWHLVVLARAYAGAADTTTPRAIGAMLLGTMALLIPIFAIAFAVGRFANG